MKKHIKKSIRETLLKEFVTSDIVSLKKYLSLTKEEKINSLPHEFPYFFNDFLNDMGLKSPIPLEGEPYETIYKIEEKQPELYHKFGDWLYNKILRYDLDVNSSEYPAWSYFDEPSLVKNQWLIHFTSDSDSIAKEGFRYGLDDMTKLGLTVAYGEFDKKYGGYNFAYTLEDYLKYAKHFSIFKYGNEAVIFKASGIKAWHNADEEPQVIFYGNTAKDIIAINDGDNAKYGVRNKNGNILFQNDEFNSVVNWVVKNFIQYRRQL